MGVKVALSARDAVELRSVELGLITNDEPAVRARARLEALGLIAFGGWDVTAAGSALLASSEAGPAPI